MTPSLHPTLPSTSPASGSPTRSEAQGDWTRTRHFIYFTLSSPTVREQGHTGVQGGGCGCKQVKGAQGQSAVLWGIILPHSSPGTWLDAPCPGCGVGRWGERMLAPHCTSPSPKHPTSTGLDGSGCVPLTHPVECSVDTLDTAPQSPMWHQQTGRRPGGGVVGERQWASSAGDMSGSTTQMSHHTTCRMPQPHITPPSQHQ